MEERVTSGVGFLSDAHAVTTAIEAIASSPKGCVLSGALFAAFQPVIDRSELGVESRASKLSRPRVAARDRLGSWSGSRTALTCTIAASPVSTDRRTPAGTVRRHTFSDGPESPSPNRHTFRRRQPTA